MLGATKKSNNPLSNVFVPESSNSKCFSCSSQITAASYQIYCCKSLGYGMCASAFMSLIKELYLQCNLILGMSQK